jgi:hypothetical protein
VLNSNSLRLTYLLVFSLAVFLVKYPADITLFASLSCGCACFLDKEIETTKGKGKLPRILSRAVTANLSFAGKPFLVWFLESVSLGRA